MKEFVQVVEEESDDEIIELPTEEDGTLTLSTLVGQFPGACGLKYRNPETRAMRGIRLVDGRLHPPDSRWGNIVFICVFPKGLQLSRQDRGAYCIDNWGHTENKRKGDDGLENPTAKTKRVEKKKCSDLIVLGLPWKSAEDDVRKYFEQFGEVIMVQIKRDLQTKQSKGYGFIRFSDYESQRKCLKQRHMIDGRWCEVRIPNSKVGTHEDCAPRKVFVGRTTEEMTADDLRTYFSHFGEVIDVFIPKPFRAFAFVTFADSDVAQGLLGEDHIIKGVSVHVSQAAPKNYDKNDMRKQQGGGGGGGGYGEGPPGYGRGGCWNQGGRGGQGLGNMANISAGNMSAAGAGTGNAANNPMNMNVGPFQLNPAMVAAASAALNQAGWGLLGLASQGGGNTSSVENPGGNQGGGFGGASQGSSSSSGFLAGGWGGPGGQGDAGNTGGWGTNQSKGAQWN